MHSTKECPCEDLFPHLSKINQEERMQSLSVKSLQQTALVTEYGHVTQLSSVTEYGQGHSSVWWQFGDRIWPCDTAQNFLCPQSGCRVHKASCVLSENSDVLFSKCDEAGWSLSLVSCSSSTYKVQWGQLWVISHLPVDPKCHLLSLHVLQYVWPAQLHKPGLIRKIECIY